MRDELAVQLEPDGAEGDLDERCLERCRRNGVDPDLVRAMAAAGAAAARAFGMPENSRDDWENELWVAARGLAQLRWLKDRDLADPEATYVKAVELLDGEELQPEGTWGTLEEMWVLPDERLVATHYDRLIVAYESRFGEARRRVLRQRQRSGPVTVAPKPALVVVADEGRPRGREGRRRRRGAAHGPPSSSDDPHEPPDLDAGSVAA